MARSPLDSIAYALCANDEDSDADHGNDTVAELILEQLIWDGHLPEGARHER